MRKSSTAASKRGKRSNEKPAQETPPKPVTTYNLTLSLTELVHIRDLFSVTLPVEMTTTLSQALAANEGRSLAESKLWKKVSDECEKAGIPTQHDAPDFVVTVSGPPPINVFRLEPDYDNAGEHVHVEVEEKNE